MPEIKRTLSDDIYDALGMSGTWWMGRLRLAEHIASKLAARLIVKEPAREAEDIWKRFTSAELSEKEAEIEALKRNIDELQADLAAAQEALDVATFAAKKRKPKAAKKK